MMSSLINAISPVAGKKRLNCFDEVFKLNAPKAQQSQLPSEKNAAMPMNVVTSPALQAPEPSNAVVSKQQRFFFTNGQIWENKTSKESRVDKGDQALVRDGALSAFYLSKVDGTRGVRVKRVK